MSFDLLHIWASMSFFSKVIAAALVLMAIGCIGVVVERCIALGRNAKDSRAFARAIAPMIDGWKVEELVEISDKHKHSVLAKLLGTITRRYLRGYEDLEGGLSPFEMAKNEAERAKEVIGAELRRGMNVLASVGSVAPFIGLLGTVVGIIAAFQGIAATGGGGLSAVSAGIAEALVETALGLCVAIPAVLAFNYLTTRVNAVELALNGSASELLDEMENHDGRKTDQDTRARRAA
jgi:biopolymer transport protein ExbB